MDRASPLPLWAQMHTDLRRRLEAGEFTDVFPGELALVAGYTVSRHTVREALRRLRSEGIVTSERGRSPRVTGPAVIEQPLGALYDELARRCGVRLSGGREHLRAVVPTATERALLGIGTGVAAFAIGRLACSGGRPTEWRHTLVRGDRFTVSAQFSVRDGYRLDGAGLDAHK